MSGHWGILVSDPGLQNQFTQAELRSLKSQFPSMRRESEKLAIGGLASKKMSRLKVVGENMPLKDGNGFSTQTTQASVLQILPDDTQYSREERAFRLWINSLGNSTYINNVFEDVRNGCVLSLPY